MADDKQNQKKAAAGAGQGRRRQGRQAKGKGAQGKKDAAADAAPRSFTRPKDYRPRLKSHYEKVVREAMVKKFSYTNPMQIPRLEKIVLNMGIGEAVNDRKKVENAAGRPGDDRRPEAGGHARPASRSPPTRCARACRSAPR